MITRSLGTSQLLAVADGSLTGAEVPLLTAGKPLALLAFLLAAPGRSASRDQLIELLWADVERDAARHTLRQTLWYLRKRTNTDIVVGSGETIRIGTTVDSDRQRFLDLLESGEREQAVAEYGGDFFPDFASPGAAAFEQWADVERQRLRGLYLGAVSAVVSARLQAGRAREALTLARQARDKVPALQATTRLVIECLVAAGDTVSAKLEAEQLARALEQDDDEPDAATSALLRRVLQERSEPTAASADDRRLTTELVGRDAAFASLLRAFEKSRRGTPVHVHVSAAAGFGKSRLLDGLAGRLLTQRARIVTVRAIPAERSIAFAFASQLASALVALRGAAAVSPGAASTIVALAPAATSYLNAVPDRADADETQRRRTLALVELLAAVAEDSHVVLLIDDVHWMDQPSRQMLAALAERVQQGKLLLVTTARPVDRFVELTPSAERLALDPLTVDDTGALLTSIASLPAEPWADLLPARLHAATAGSPLLIVETLQLALERELLTAAQGEWACASPTELLAVLGTGKAIQQRLSALPAAAGDALLAMASIGEPVTEETLGTVLGLADVRDATALLDARGLAVRINDTWRPAHDEIAALVVDLSSDRRRVEMHRAIGDWLEQQPTTNNAWPLARATWHRSRSGDRTGMTRAFTRFVERTRAMGLATPAAELARDALGTETPDAELQQLVAMLPRRLRSRLSRWVVRAAAAAACFAAGALTLRESRATPTPNIAFVTRVPDANGAWQWVRAEVALDALGSGDAVDLRAIDPPVAPSAVEQLTTLRGTATGRALLASTIRQDSAALAIDIVRVSSHGGITPVVSAERDQNLLALSPGGAQALFIDRRYWPSQAADLSLLDLATGRVRRLTQTPTEERAGAFSPDGRDIAFTRPGTDSGGVAICRLHLADARERCVSGPSGYIPNAVRAWRADGALVVEAIARRSGLAALLLLAASDDHVTTVHEGAAMYVVDPTGRLALSRQRYPGVDRLVVSVLAVDQPAALRPLRWSGALVGRIDANVTDWGSPPSSAVRVAIDVADSLVVGERAQLRATAFDARNQEIGVAARQWTSRDRRLLQVDSHGVLTPLTTGSTRIVLALENGVTDSVPVRVVAPSARALLRETFTAPLSAQWFLLGAPRPRLLANGARSVLHLNGDERLTSAAVSRIAANPRAGLGLRVRFRLPISSPIWQSLTIGIEPVAGDSALRALELLPESPQPSDWSWRPSRSCSMRLPRGEGAEFRDMLLLDAAGNTVATKGAVPAFGDSALHTAEIQLFADGRCAFRLDGVELGVSELAVQMDRSMRVYLGGQSVNTTLAIEEVEFWQGVRGGRAKSGPQK